MTLAVDSSVLIQRYVPGPDRGIFLDAMNRDPIWCASELARTELLLALHRLAGRPDLADELWRSARDDWDTFVVIPVDSACLATAADIGSKFRLSTVDAIHLAAADRLPRPVSYATLDSNQIPAAAALGLDVIAPLST